jgi:2-haloacid dehalogenase
MTMVRLNLRFLALHFYFFMHKPLSTSKSKVILFDVNETLLDMSKLKNALMKAFNNKAAFQQWFGLLLQYSLVDTVTSHYHDFRTIGDAALDMTANMLQERSLKSAERHKLLDLMTELPAHKDVPEGLNMLSKAGYSLVAFTNSTRSVLDQQLRYADLIHYFEQGLSVDDQRRYKPQPDTYLTAARQAGADPSSTIMIAAHGWDITGALHAGLAAGFIARKGQTLYPLAPSPTYQGKTLIEVAKQIIAQKAPQKL